MLIQIKKATIIGSGGQKVNQMCAFQVCSGPKLNVIRTPCYLVNVGMNKFLVEAIFPKVKNPHRLIAMPSSISLIIN